MFKLRHAVVVLTLLLAPLTSSAEVSVGIALPNISIGINLPLYPRLVRIPDYPVYYAPHVEANYFFYDGMYWVFQDDDWYVSAWYNGPWSLVVRHDLPAFILRIPVRYYRRPPAHFHGWQMDRPPHWGERWGHDWEKRRIDWDKWDRHNTPRPAPRPSYQRRYSGERYPHQIERQHELNRERYRYQPRDPVVRKHYQGQGKGHGRGRGRDDDD